MEEKNEDAIKNFEERHKLGKKNNEHRGLGKLIVFLAILFGVGAWAYTSGWNPFVKKWYEDCGSELMKKSFYDGFKMYVERQNSNYKLKDMELISQVTMIEKEPLKCSVRVSYNLSLGTYRYQVGTATMIRIHKNIENATNTINADWILVDDISKVHSLFNGNY